MRSFSNFLLFEDVLSNLPPESTLLTSVASSLMSPSVKIVEEDCGTLLGTFEETNFEKEGLIELATGDMLSRARITELISLSQYKVATRNLHSCISKNGICRKCYAASYITKPVPPLNTQIRLDSILTYQNEIIAGDNITNVKTLSLDESEYDLVVIIKDGAIVSSGYSISGNKLTFTTIPLYSDVYVIRYYTETSEPLQGYLARSYSGDLLGMKPLPTLPTLIKESLYTSILPDGILSVMELELHRYKAIPSTYLDYIGNIKDRLERALFIIYLYAIFSNVQI